MIIIEDIGWEDGLEGNTWTLPLAKALLNNTIACDWNLHMTMEALGTPLVTSVVEALKYF